jgi:hypothetical protein
VHAQREDRLKVINWCRFCGLAQGCGLGYVDGRGCQSGGGVS